MAKSQILSLLLVLVLAGLALPACSGSDQAAAEPQATATQAGDETQEVDALGAKIKGFFGDLISRLEAAPLIGAPLQRLLSRLAPEDHWCVGAVLLVLVGLLIAAVASTARD